MGLTVRAKGLSNEDGFDCGYITYGLFIAEVVRAAYGEKCYEVFCRQMRHDDPMTQDEADAWDAVCNKDLELLIWHSDGDGKFTWQECRRIYNALLPLKSDMQGHNYGIMKPYNMFEQWKGIFKHCADRRVNLYYT